MPGSRVPSRDGAAGTGIDPAFFCGGQQQLLLIFACAAGLGTTAFFLWGSACILHFLRRLWCEQVILDRQQTDYWSLAVLIFDAIQIGREDFVQMNLPPAERYRRLMNLCHYAPDVLVSPIMRVQWAGQYAALKRFCTGPGSEKNLDHLTENFFRYTREHPCKIVMTD